MNYKSRSISERLLLLAGETASPMRVVLMDFVVLAQDVRGRFGAFKHLSPYSR